MITSALCPLTLAREDVATASCDITPIFQPANVNVLRAHLILQAGLAPLLHADVLYVAGKLGLYQQFLCY